MRVFKSNQFNRYARTQHLTDAELWQVATRVENPALDHDLGCGLIRQRVPRPETRRRNGYCSILTYRTDVRALILYGFPRDQPDELCFSEFIAFSALAGEFLRLKDDAIAMLMDRGQFIEVRHA